MILAQDGHGPGTKIEDGIDAGYIEGAVLSLRSRHPDRLHHAITKLTTDYPDKKFLLDTHFYASELAMTRPGKTLDHSLFDKGLTRKDFTVKKIAAYAQRIVDYQRELGLTNIILPSLTISNFDDYTSQISLQLYEASLDYIKEVDDSLKPYLSLVFHEIALNDKEKLSEYLDDLTLLEGVTGFYIVTERSNTKFPQWQDSRTLAKLMYVVNTLSDNYDVICGFLDFPGILLLGSGANHVASGWHQTLRQYHGSYFMGSSGGNGNNKKFRYASKDLLAEILSEPDLQSLIRTDKDKYIDSEYGDGLQDPSNLVFPQAIRPLHQWKMFHELGEQITTASNPMNELKKLIGQAEQNLEELRKKKILLDRESVGHLGVWMKAIDSYISGVL